MNAYANVIITNTFMCAFVSFSATYIVKQSVGMDKNAQNVVLHG
jgi:hypothetical protein